MFKKLVIFISLLIFMSSCEFLSEISDSDDAESVTTPSSDSSGTVSLVFTGPSDSTNSLSTAYVAWIENEEGDNLQNLYVCNRVAANVGYIDPDPDTTYSGLYGTALPNWSTIKYVNNSDIDDVTGASTQLSNTITVSLDVGSETEIYVFFEIDRSKNSNTYFYDRPSYTYKSDLIDIDSLSTDGSYSFELNGWMSNDTGNTDQYIQYSQEPKETITGWAVETYMTDAYLSWIADSEGNTDDLVTSLTVTISEE